MLWDSQLVVWGKEIDPSEEFRELKAGGIHFRVISMETRLAEVNYEEYVAAGTTFLSGIDCFKDRKFLAKYMQK